MFIDVHTHMFSDRWLDRLLSSDTPYEYKDRPGGGKSILKAGTPFVSVTSAMFDYDERIKAMDEAEIDMAVVSLTCPNVFWGGEEISAIAAEESNDDMMKAQEKFPERIRYFASLPWQYPDRAIAELDRAVSNGAVGVMVLGNIEGKALTDDLFAPVWEAIDKKGLPVLVHPTNPPSVEDLNLGKYHLSWSVGFPFDTTLALATMVLDGFFDRYKNLKIIGSHGGGTFPYLMGRLDAGFEYFPTSKEKIDSPASNHIDNLYIDSILYSQGALDYAISVVNPDHVLFGTDYPHLCGDMVGAKRTIDHLGSEVQDKIKFGNAQRIFSL